MNLSGPILTTLAVLTALGIVGMLQCIASAAKQGRDAIDLAAKVAELRRVQLERLRQMNDGTPKLRYATDEKKKAA